MLDPTRFDRIAGFLFGGAVGDALGATCEGRSAASFSIPDELNVTDDTQLTLATCEAILEAGRVDPEVIARNFVRWFREGRLTGLGSSTLKALTELDAGGHWALVGATGEKSAGNGAAMRIAPLAFFLDPDQAADRQLIRDVCRITHRNDEAYLGALAVVRTIRHVFQGNTLDRAWLDELNARLPDCQIRDRLRAVRTESLSIEDYAATLGTSGHVVDTVPLAILAACDSTLFLDTVARLISCGGDTDSIGSIYGQIAGAATGAEALPPLALHVEHAELIQKLSARLSQL